MKQRHPIRCGIILIIGLLFLFVPLSAKVTDQTANAPISSVKHIPKMHPNPKPHIKLTADRIWERHYDIYVVSDPDLPEPGFGSYHLKIFVESSHLYTPGPSIVGGIQAVYKNLEYPDLLEEMEIGGKVTILVFVEADGIPSTIRVKGHSTFYEFDKAACEAVRNVKFNPDKYKEKPLSAELTIPIEFIPREGIDSCHQVPSEMDDLFFGLSVDPPYPLPKGSWEDLWKIIIHSKESQNTKGYTVVRTYIDANGKVTRTRIIRPSKYPTVDSTAMDTIKKTEFKPAMLRGKIPVGAWFNIPVIYKLDE